MIYYTAYPEEDINPLGIQAVFEKKAVFTVPDNMSEYLNNGSLL